MYKFCLNDDKTIILSNPRWITILSNGTYGRCDEKEALGVCINGVVYKLKGIDGIDTDNIATVSNVSEDAYQLHLLQIQEQTERALAELSILIASGGVANV